MHPTPETAPGFASSLNLIDRGKRGGVLRAFGAADLADRLHTINGVAVRLIRRRPDRYEGRLTPAEVQEMRGRRA